MKKIFMLLIMSVIFIGITEAQRVVLKYDTPTTVISKNFTQITGTDTTVILQLLNRQAFGLIISSDTSMSHSNGTVKGYWSIDGVTTSANYYTLDSAFNTTLSDSICAYSKTAATVYYPYLILKIAKGSNTKGAFKITAFQPKPTTAK